MCQKEIRHPLMVFFTQIVRLVEEFVLDPQNKITPRDDDIPLLFFVSSDALALDLAVRAVVG